MQPEFDEFCRTLVSNAGDAIVYADGEGVIRYWNGAAERMFGFNAAEAIGRSLDLIIPDRLRARHWQGYRETMATGKSRYRSGALLSVPGLHKEGTQISIEFTVVPIAGPAGELLGIAAVMRDVTQRYNELQDLRRRVATKDGGGAS